MATYYDDQGREYRLGPHDESPRRKIMGYSRLRQGTAGGAARERAKQRVKGSFGGLDEYYAMQGDRNAQNEQQTPQKPVLPPKTIRRPGLQSQEEKMVDEIAPPSEYTMSLTEMVTAAREKAQKKRRTP
jgi:hypothetical protein